MSVERPGAIALEGVSKRFAHRVRGEVYAVRDVSLAVRAGELLTLLGPSGCGKTTTLRMIAGFEQPDAGRILVDGRDVTGVPAADRHLGMVFQNYALFPHLTVADNVAYGLRVRRQAGAEVARAVEEVLALVGLRGHERQLPNQLSGGEQQRVALARAIVIRPRVLLFDEPLSNLDAALRVQMRGEIQRLQRALGITAVYVTHDQEEAMAISDRIAVMQGGRIVQAAPAEEIYTRPATEFVARFIGRANVLEGRIVAVDGAGAELEVAGGRLRVTGAPEVTVGAPARAVVRPEAIGIEPAGDGEGAVESSTFLGEKVEYHVRLGATLLQVTGYGPARGAVLRPGERVRVRWPADGVRLLPGGEA